MLDQFARTRLLLGDEGLARLAGSKVMIFGVGGVGSFTVEALARAGVGHLVLVDFDMVDVTNINRQLPALLSTVGSFKVDVLKKRIADINEKAQVTVYREKVTPENVRIFFQENPSYVVDAIDMVSGKIAIIEAALGAGIPFMSALGAGNRLDPTKLQIGDISETTGDPLARIMRRELRKRGIKKGVKVVYSTELPLKPGEEDRQELTRRVPGSISYVPSVAGLFLAAQVVRDLLD
ncbi:MAG: tRNA threonylcarbamoyladenosine dehydratase [Peptococcia bacterium]